jgi:hypothetical protein
MSGKSICVNYRYPIVFQQFSMGVLLKNGSYRLERQTLFNFIRRPRTENPGPYFHRDAAVTASAPFQLSGRH